LFGHQLIAFSSFKYCFFSVTNLHNTIKIPKVSIFKQINKKAPIFFIPMAPTLLTTQFSNPAEVTDFVVYKGNGVKGLSETGIKALPEQYIQPLEERLINKFVNETDEAIPVIDMSNPDEDRVAEAVCDAAEKWGFFQVINHGVPLEVLDDVKAATHKFFNLPVEEKRKFTKENSLSTTVRFGTSFSPLAEQALEWKDYLSLFFVSEAEAEQFWPDICR